MFVDEQWLPVLSRTCALAWQRRGDTWAQVGALILVAVISAPGGHPALTAVQIGATILAALVAWMLGCLPGARRARNILLSAVATLDVVATAAGSPTLTQVCAIAPVLLGAGVGMWAPHPDDTHRPDPVLDGGSERFVSTYDVRPELTRGGVYRSQRR